MKNIAKFYAFFVSLLLCLNTLCLSALPVYGLEAETEAETSENFVEKDTAVTVLRLPEPTSDSQVTDTVELPETESSTKKDELSMISMSAASESTFTGADDEQAESEARELTVAEKATFENSDQLSVETSKDLPGVAEAPVMRGMAAPVNPVSDFVFDRSTGTINDYVGYRKDVVIPSTIGGVAVKSIAFSAFRNKGLKSVSIPSSVTELRSYAFSENQLTSIRIPNSVTKMDRGVFSHNQLTDVTLPENCTYIDREMFSSNQLSNIKIPDSVKYIHREAFYNNKLTGLKLPNSVLMIGIDAFAANKLTSIVIPDSVVELQRGAFEDNQLASATIPNSLNSIPLWAFRHNQLTSVTIPDSVTFIGEHAFADNRLTSVTIPNSVNTIRSGAFTENQLTTVTVPNSVTELAFDAFDYNVRIIRSSAYGMAVARAGFQNPVEVGTAVTLAQRAVGGEGGSKYKFSVKRSNGSIVSFGGYRAQNNYTWRPVTPDTYTVIFEAIDAAGNTAKTTRTLRVIPSPYYIAVARAGFQNPVSAGASIALAQRAEGGTGASKYKFSVRRSNGSIVTFGGYRSQNNYTWTPMTPDTYTVIFEARDAVGRTAKTTRTLKVLPKPYRIAVARAGYKNPVAAGTPVILAQRAENGVGVSRYKFSVIRSNGRKVTFGDYSGRNSYTWTPATPDTYTVLFEAMDAAGRKAESTRVLTVK